MTASTSEGTESSKLCSPFGDCLLSDRCPPLVFRGAIDQWPSVSWTPAHLACVLKDRKFQCKLCPVDVEDKLWETDCMHLQITMSDYCDWLNQRPRGDNPLSPFDPGKFSCYIDYKYMNDMFKDTPEILKEVSWDVFGLCSRDGRDSTIWIGSAGAYTPCHQDTYGFNLVAQLYGSKRWYLFPPWQTDSMYPTRIPYEESSIYSELNVRFPDLHTHTKFQNVTPYVVTLTPGQVLYVPRHWWHFVECIESAISVNTWVPMAADVTSHFQEAVCRCLVTSLSPMATDDVIINTNEELQQTTVNLQYVQTALSEHLQTMQTGTDNSTLVDDDTTTTNERFRTGKNSCKDLHDATRDTNLENMAEHFTAHVLHCAYCDPDKCHIEYRRKRKNEKDSVDEQDSISHEPCQKTLKTHSNKSCSLIDSDSNCDTVVDISSDNERETVSDLVAKESLGTVKTKSEKLQSVSIMQLEPISFSAFKKFIEKEFLYESSCANSSVGSDAVHSSCGPCTSSIASPVVSVNDIVSSVLHPSVIQRICDVLVEKKGK